MKRLARLGAATAAAVLFTIGCTSDQPRKTQTRTLTILQTSDLHANVMPWNYFTATADEKVGLAKVATLVERERAANPCSLLIDNGDTIQGTPLGSRYALVDTTSKHPMAVAMNQVGYDAMTLGNHEFNYGLTTLNRFQADANFPLLAANVKKADGTPAYTPYVIKTVCGVKVGIVGLVTPGVTIWETPENIPGLTFGLPIPAAVQYVAEARAAGAEVIVVAFHAGPDRQPTVAGDAGWLTDPAGWVPNGSMDHENDVIELAQQVPGIDVILTGHTHLAIPKLLIGDTVVVQPNRWGSHLARVSLAVDDAAGPFKVRTRDSSLVAVDATVAPSAGVTTAVKPYHDATVLYVEEVIGSTVAEFPGGDPARFTDGALADFINAVQLDAAAKGGHPAQVSLAAIFNDSGKLPSGDVKLRDAYSAYVYDNTLYVMEITGQVLKDALEQDARFFVTIDPAALPATPAAAKDPTARDYNWDLYSGVDYTIDLTRDAGSRVTSLTMGGAPVTPDQKIVIAVNNYRGGGGGGFPMFKQGTMLWRSADGVRDYIAAYVKAHPALDPAAFNTCNFKLIPDLYDLYFPGSPQKCTAPFTVTASGGADLAPGQSATLSAAPQPGLPASGWAWTWSDGLTGSRQGTLTASASGATYRPASCLELGFGDHRIDVSATGVNAPLAGVASATITLHCPAQATGAVSLKVLAINDFHGQISAGKKVSNRAIGSAPVLASYLRTAMTGREPSTILVEAGDFVGASPASSALLQDEPSISFFNSFANASCGTMPAPAQQAPGTGRFDALFDPGCNLVGVPGNHEFDEGVDELLRLLGGGNHSSGPFLDDPWGGARFPVVSSNITTADGSLLFRPWVVKSLNGVQVAFIGATLKSTPTIVIPAGVAGLTFGDEAAAINAQVQALQARGVHAFVVVLHAGGTGQVKYAGPTNPAATGLSAEIIGLVGQLDADVDVVLTAHSHSFANQLVKNAGFKDVLVTQAYSSGTAYADIDLTVDGPTQEITAKTAQIVDTFADVGPGLTPDAAVAALVTAAEAKVAPLVSALVTTTTAVLTKAVPASGEAVLGDLVADAHRATMAADFGVTNPGGLRADLPVTCSTAGACVVTWNDCFTAQPFFNVVMKVTITGQQLLDVLEQQWTVTGAPKFLQVSGFTYQWSASAAAGAKVVAGSLRKGDGTVIDVASSYTLALNNFLQGGGDGFTIFTATTGAVAGPTDIDALVAYLKLQTGPVAPPAGGRITSVP
jgi:2',3'-cyclic-nucleotide 2'-phosphodiesterase/3'-nucleotidase